MHPFPSPRRECPRPNVARGFRQSCLFLAIALGCVGRGFGSEVTSLLAEARDARDTKDYARAEKLLGEAIAAQPSSSEAYLARGMVWLAQKKQDLAVADFNQAVAVDPSNPHAWLIRGDLAHRLIAGNFAACEADYAIVLQLDPKLPHFRAYSAELYLYMKQPGRVIAEALQGLLAEPTAPIHKINLAHGLAFVGQVDAAKTLYATVGREDIERGLTGAKLALGDFAQLRRRGIDYPQIAELTPFLESLITHP